ncbi:5-deoxy-glucuronate isomerase [Actinoallomurus sp. CA-150999]|uniref:5-deoxy-glucuronate isomerase n=1 Tax=Actinoallomurus sp. CA-150999 TaxID=3239887 RepID=UPI003D8A93DB
MKTLLTPGKDTELIGLDVADLAEGETLELTREEEIVAVVLSGVVDVDGLGTAGGRSGVFEGPGHTVYAPPGHALTFRATGGPAQIVIATAPLGDGTPAQARIIGPDDQQVDERGEGNWSRTVRTVLGPDDDAGRLLFGETINPPGNWSSYPPHKHDTHEPPREVKLEEVYLFKFEPGNGFGVQIRYDGEGEEVFTVRDGDVAAIPAGYHPVVAAPGYSMCYLWFMAGEGRRMIPYLDPEHAWVQNG